VTRLADVDVMACRRQEPFRLRQARLRAMVDTDEVSQEALILALADRRWEIRRDALALCCDRADIPVDRFVERLTRDRSWRVRSTALVCLCLRYNLHPRSPAYQATMWAREHDPDPRIRARAAQMIGHLEESGRRYSSSRLGDIR
jgi:hypothetical protein